MSTSREQSSLFREVLQRLVLKRQGRSHRPHPLPWCVMKNALSGRGLKPYYIMYLDPMTSYLIFLVQSIFKYQSTSAIFTVTPGSHHTKQLCSKWCFLENKAMVKIHTYFEWLFNGWNRILCVRLHRNDIQNTEISYTYPINTNL